MWAHAGETSEVTIGAPKLPYAMLYDERGDVSIVREVSLGPPLSHLPQKVSDVSRPLTQEYKRGRGKQRFEVL